MYEAPGSDCNTPSRWNMTGVIPPRQMFLYGGSYVELVFYSDGRYQARGYNISVIIVNSCERIIL